MFRSNNFFQTCMYLFLNIFFYFGHRDNANIVIWNNNTYTPQSPYYLHSEVMNLKPFTRIRRSYLNMQITSLIRHILSIEAKNILHQITLCHRHYHQTICIRHLFFSFLLDLFYYRFMNFAIKCFKQHGKPSKPITLTSCLPHAIQKENNFGMVRGNIESN